MRRTVLLGRPPEGGGSFAWLLALAECRHAITANLLKGMLRDQENSKQPHLSTNEIPWDALKAMMCNGVCNESRILAPSDR